MTKLIEGEVLTPGEDEVYRRLHKRVTELVEQNRQLQDQLLRSESANEKLERALKVLKRQLTPLYTALQAVFGELEIVNDGASLAENSAAAGTGQLLPRQQQIIDSWKSRLGAGPGKIIDALILHGPMNVQQLATATGYNRNTVPQYLGDLRKTGLLHKTSDGKQELRLP